MPVTVEGYLLDTSVASAAFDEGNPEHKLTRNRLDQLCSSDRIFICAATLAEIEYGMKAASIPNAGRHTLVRNALRQYVCLEIDHHTAEEYSTIRAKLFDKYAPRNSKQRFQVKYVEDLIEPTTGKQLGIQENDLWIVSVAVQYDLVFITRDRKGGMARVLEEANYTSRTQFWQ